jgi:hypothetical protein
VGGCSPNSCCFGLVCRRLIILHSLHHSVNLTSFCYPSTQLSIPSTCTSFCILSTPFCIPSTSFCIPYASFCVHSTSFCIPSYIILHSLYINLRSLYVILRSLYIILHSLYIILYSLVHHSVFLPHTSAFPKIWNLNNLFWLTTCWEVLFAGTRIFPMYVFQTWWKRQHFNTHSFRHVFIDELTVSCLSASLSVCFVSLSVWLFFTSFCLSKRPHTLFITFMFTVT